ncbi:MAG TPA: asparagine synthase-related protein [Thermoanaerobaculia bacterium]|nr:asparagine synthase-related protein [Thermoanaerobaculia bacterium]
MSGIVAVFRRDGRPVEAGEVERMLAAVPECSVDGQSAWVAGEVGLGHQRFWVLPEEMGEVQPLFDAEIGCVLVADLRLDNRGQLLRELAVTGDDAALWSDARLLLAGYLRWGQACVERLMGDFAFVLWDEREKRLFAARDPMGARGLSYHLSDGVALLASNVEQLLAHGAFAARLNESRVVDLLTMDWSDQAATFYRDVLDLVPGATLTVTATRAEVREFCDLLPVKRLRYRDQRNYAEHYRELVTEAVACRLRSTGRIGLSLSGGLDSTLLAAIAAPMVPQGGGASGLQCYSYAFERHPSCDERPFIEPLVAHLGVGSRYAWCDDLWTLRDADRWPVHRDYVLTDPYAWLPQAVNRLASQDGCRVLLGGYYGDVLTAGSREWAAGMAADGRLGELTVELWKNRSLPVWAGAARSLGRAMLPLWIDRLRRRPARRRGESQPALDRRLVGAADRVNSRRGFHRHLRLACFTQGPASVRRTYHALGLEPLSPYEDRRLVEFVLAIPADQLGRPGDGNDRRIHREAARGLLPEPIRSRKDRTSFLALLREGLFDREAATVARLLARPRIVDMGQVAAVWLETHPPTASLPVEDLEVLWLCLCLEMWLRKFW